MRVTELIRSESDERARTSALVTWEDSDRPQRRIYFETTRQFAEHLSPNPNAFLLATVMFALRHGEKRVLVDGQLCPTLRNGVVAATKQIAHWHGAPFDRPVRIEATEGFAPPLPRPKRRTASFMSGGIDALALLRKNRLDYPVDHPGSIRDCFFLYGFDMGCHESLEGNEAGFEQAVKLLSALTQRTQAELIPVYTNMFHLDDDDDLAFVAVFGASLAAVGHAFNGRVAQAQIASSDDIMAGLKPMGSHPLLDPNYSSADLQIIHEGTWMTRMDKVRLISDWDDGLQHVRACFDFFRPAENINCGRCEKCLRTMTQLLVCGKLEACTTYPFDDVTPEMLRGLQASPLRVVPRNRRKTLENAMRCLNVVNVNSWYELVPLLSGAGRHDLVAGIEAKLAEFNSFAARREGRDWIGRLLSFDRKYLGGRAANTVRRFRG